MLSLISPSEAVIKIASLMKQKRLEKNLTQDRLSEDSGVSLATLRKFERTGEISFKSFIKLTFHLNEMNNILNALEKEEEFSSMDEVTKANKKDEKPKRKRASRGSRGN